MDCAGTEVKTARDRGSSGSENHCPHGSRPRWLCAGAARSQPALNPAATGTLRLQRVQGVRLANGQEPARLADQCGDEPRCASWARKNSALSARKRSIDYAVASTGGQECLMLMTGFRRLRRREDASEPISPADRQ